MDERKLLRAVVTAGEIMLVSGAEVHRVEDTMNYMLAHAGCETAETVVYTTGILVSLITASHEPLTFVKRISERSTNINRIYLVNDISRRFCAGTLTVDEVLAELEKASRAVQYSRLAKSAGIVGVAAFFSPIFGGGVPDFAGAALVGVFLALANRISIRFKLNDFCANAFGALVAAFSASALGDLFPMMQSDVMIISSIMTLVPGVTFTTAIRDTLNGDYMAGAARMTEAVVVALAVAAGVGSGLFLYQMMGGAMR